MKRTEAQDITRKLGLDPSDVLRVTLEPDSIRAEVLERDRNGHPWVRGGEPAYRVARIPYEPEDGA